MTSVCNNDQQWQPETFAYAWVSSKDTLYFAKIANTYSGPSTAVVKLIQGIFDQFIDHSFFILRNRIYTTSEENFLDHSIVKLAAKRISFAQPLPHPLGLKLMEILPHTELIQSEHLTQINTPSPSSVVTSAEATSFLQNLIMLIPRGEIRHDWNRPVAAFLTSEKGEVLGYATNSNMKNKTLHAETVLMQQYYQKYQKSLPEGAQIFVSLKPCKMCAAMIHQLSHINHPARVYYLEEDLGASAQNTILDLLGRVEKLS